MRIIIGGLGGSVSLLVLRGLTPSDVVIIDEPAPVVSDIAVRRAQTPRAAARSYGGLAVRRSDPGPSRPRQRAA